MEKRVIKVTSITLTDKETEILMEAEKILNEIKVIMKEGSDYPERALLRNINSDEIINFDNLLNTIYVMWFLNHYATNEFELS